MISHCVRSSVLFLGRSRVAARYLFANLKCNSRYPLQWTLVRFCADFFPSSFFPPSFFQLDFKSWNGFNPKQIPFFFVSLFFFSFLLVSLFFPFFFCPPLISSSPFPLPSFFFLSYILFPIPFLYFSTSRFLFSSPFCCFSFSFLTLFYSPDFFLFGILRRRL